MTPRNEHLSPPELHGLYSLTSWRGRRNITLGTCVMEIKKVRIELPEAEEAEEALGGRVRDISIVLRPGTDCAWPGIGSIRTRIRIRKRSHIRIHIHLSRLTRARTHPYQL